MPRQQSLSRQKHVRGRGSGWMIDGWIKPDSHRVSFSASFALPIAQNIFKNYYLRENSSLPSAIWLAYFSIEPKCDRLAWICLYTHEFSLQHLQRATGCMLLQANTGLGKTKQIHQFIKINIYSKIHHLFCNEAPHLRGALWVLLCCDLHCTEALVRCIRHSKCYFFVL